MQTFVVRWSDVVLHSRLILVGLLALTAPAWGGEKLVCVVVHKGTDYRAAKTEIITVDPESAEKQIVFSDEDAAIVLLQRLYVFHFPAVGGGKLFAHGAERGKPVQFPGNASLYELSADGSDSFRRIASVIGGESLGDIFVNPAGTRIGYVNRLGRKQYIFIHDVKTGELIHQVDVTEVLLDCYASGIGWLPGGDTLFFSLETGDVHITSDESYDRVGVYTMDESGDNLTKLGPVPAREGFHPPETVRVIGVLPTGEYVLETMQQRLRGVPGKDQRIFAILKSKLSSGYAEDISFSLESRLYSGIRVSYKLSSSGKYLAAAALPISSSSNSTDIWLKNVAARHEKKLLSIATDGLNGPFLGLVGWFD
jgi:hypothetical protein